MQVWNVVHVARWKHRTQKSRQKLPSGHHRTTLSGYVFATKAHIGNRKKLVKQQYVLHMSPQYGKLRPTNGWDRSGSLGHPCKISTGFSSWQRYCTASSSGRQPNFAALNRGRHLYSAGRPSGWALAHISSCQSVASVPIILFASWRTVTRKSFENFIKMFCHETSLRTANTALIARWWVQPFLHNAGRI